MDIVLDKEANPKVIEILDGFNELMEEWNVIQEELDAYAGSIIFSPSKKKRLKELGTRAIQLQKKWLEHNNKAISFAWHPSFKFPAGPTSELSFHLYHRLLLDRINQFRANMTLLVANFNLRMGELDHARDLNLALAAFLLSFIGLAGSFVL